MYRFSLKLKPETKSRLKRLQKEIEVTLGTQYSLNSIIEAIIDESLKRFESVPTNVNKNSSA